MPAVREAQARSRAASRTRSASAIARSLKNAKRKRDSAQPQEIDRRFYSRFPYLVAGSLSLQSSTIQIESTVRFEGGKGSPRSAINFRRRAAVSGRATAD